MITIHKSSTEKSSTVRVTFAMPAIESCDRLYLVGWFGEWDETVYRMERATDGTWSLTLELEPGCEYLYSFRTLDGQWMIDPDAPRASSQFGPKTSFVLSAESSM